MVCSSIYFTSKARAARLARCIETLLQSKNADAGLIRCNGKKFEWYHVGTTGLRLCFLGVPVTNGEYTEDLVPALESLYEALFNTEAFAC